MERRAQKIDGVLRGRRVQLCLIPQDETINLVFCVVAARLRHIFDVTNWKGRLCVDLCCSAELWPRQASAAFQAVKKSLELSCCRWKSSLTNYCKLTWRQLSFQRGSWKGFHLLSLQNKEKWAYTCFNVTNVSIMRFMMCEVPTNRK